MAVRRRELIDFAVFHLLFAILATGVLMSFSDWTHGPKLFALVIVYNVALPVWATLRRLRNWMAVWTFVFPLSLMLVVPDWFLSGYFEILDFPEDGLFKWFGEVSGFMAGLWAIPLFIITYLGLMVENRGGTWAAYAVVTLLAALIFVGSEQLMPLLPAWSAQNVQTWGNVARYVVGPELILAWSCFALFSNTRKRGLPGRLSAAVLIVLIYTGSLALSYFFVEGWA